MPVYPPADGHFPQYTGPVSSMGNAATRPSSAAFSFGASDRTPPSQKAHMRDKKLKQGQNHNERPRTSSDAEAQRPVFSHSKRAPVTASDTQGQKLTPTSELRPQTTPGHKPPKYTWLNGTARTRTDT